MRCRYCRFEEGKVIGSRPTEEGYAIRRRRECIHCLKRFTTYENIERKPLMVIKRDRSRQVFDSSKLLNRLLIACAKRPIPIATLEQIVEESEAKLEEEKTAFKEKAKVQATKLEEMVKNFKLVGISWSNDPDAIIEDEKAKKTYFVKTGDKINKISIEAIYRDRVILHYLTEEVELR